MLGLVKKLIIYFSSKCVAQDDVVRASCVASQEGKKWSRTCYQVSSDCVLYKFNTDKVRYSLKYPYLQYHTKFFEARTLEMPICFGIRNKIDSTVTSSDGQYINISILII